MTTPFASSRVMLTEWERWKKAAACYEGRVLCDVHNLWDSASRVLLGIWGSNFSHLP